MFDNCSQGQMHALFALVCSFVLQLLGRGGDLVDGRLLDTLRVHVLVPLVGAEQDVKHRNMRAIVLGHQVMVVDVVARRLVALPVRRHRQHLSAAVNTSKTNVKNEPQQKHQDSRKECTM